MLLLGENDMFGGAVCASMGGSKKGTPEIDWSLVPDPIFDYCYYCSKKFQTIKLLQGAWSKEKYCSKKCRTAHSHDQFPNVRLIKL